MPTPLNSSNGMLAAPERNNFFYGKLMDVTQFEKEQRYFNQKRWLLNRLVLGSGVVCGLNVVRDAEGMTRIQPGVAIDGDGRELVVPEAVPINPRQPTDDQGTPEGEPIDEGQVDICLAYAETRTDLVPVSVPDCDTPGNCAPSTIREGFRVLVRRAEGHPPQPPTCKLEGFSAAAEELHKLLSLRISEGCPEAPADPCVLLARVTLSEESININPHIGRGLVYGNALLYELILCLAQRVEELATG